MRQIACCFVLAFASSAIAQNCESVIALSKTVETVVEDRKSLEAAASSFCNAYSRSTTSTDSGSFGLSYGVLAASFGSTSASAASVASRYCSAQNASQAREDAYRRYVESISPNAYQAYEKCIEFSQKDLKFALDPGTMLPDEFTLVALFASRAQGAKAKLAVTSSKDVTCSWAGNNSEPLLESGSSAALKCVRADAGKKSYVSVFSPSIAVAPLSIPWQAYAADGTPVDALAALRASVISLQAEVGKGQAALEALRTWIAAVEKGVPNTVLWADDPHHPAVKDGETKCDTGGHFMMGVWTKAGLNGNGISGLSCRRVVLTRQ